MNPRRVLPLALIVIVGCDPLSGGARGTAPSPGQMVTIPQGEFIMGSDQTDTAQQGVEFGTAKPWFLDEHPQRTVTLPTYQIDVYETTNDQYRQFVDATRAAAPPTWPDGRFPADQGRWPVTGITWFEADRFCRWAGKRLPTEAEWEKAARGTDGREYPWGNAFDEKKGNIGSTGLAAVGSFPEGKSPYGVEDMAGNVSEWVADWYQPYPGSTYTSPAFGERFKVVRNSSWGGSAGHYTVPHFYRAAYRFYQPPERRFRDIGFRCAR